MVLPCVLQIPQYRLGHARATPSLTSTIKGVFEMSLRRIFPAKPSATFSIIGCLVLFLTVPWLNFQWFDQVCHTLSGWINPSPLSVPEPDFQVLWASNGGA